MEIQKSYIFSEYDLRRVAKFNHVTVKLFNGQEAVVKYPYLFIKKSKRCDCGIVNFDECLEIKTHFREIKFVFKNDRMIAKRNHLSGRLIKIFGNNKKK